MVRDSRRDGGSSPLFIIALCASLAVVLAILFNFVRSDPPGYELTGSVLKKAPDSPLPK